MSTARVPLRASRVPLRASRVIALFVFGAIVVSIFDGFHTHSGTTTYATPIFAQAAWWTPVIFGASVGFGGPLFVRGYEMLGGDEPAPSWSRIGSAFVAFGALYYFSGFYHGANATKLVVLGASAIAIWALIDRTWQGAACTLATAIIGPSVEVVLVHFATFVHNQPDFLGVPMWLPALYACSAPIIGHGARKFLSM